MGIFTGAGSRIHLDEPQIIGLVMQLVGGPLVLVANKPPLLGEVARRSRDGEVASLGEDGALAFSMMPIHKSNGMQHHQSQQPLRRCAPAPLAGEPFGWAYSLEQEVGFI